MRTGGRKTFAETIRLPPPGGTITRILQSLRDPEIVTVRIGRNTAGRIPAAAAKRLGAHEGAEWTNDLREALLTHLAEAKAREYALRTAARRPLTRRQLQDKLAQRGLSFDRARVIAEDLAARGVIDEPALARHVAGVELARKSAGKTLLVAKLRRRGIDARTAEKATAAAIADSGVDPREGAGALARRKARSLRPGLDPRAAQRRVYAFLARRGFDPETCGRATRDALAGAHQSDQ